MVDNLARKHEAGSSLPPFIRAKMEALGFSPTLRELARRLNRDSGPLYRNLTGQSEMTLGNAKRMAEVLDVTVDELIHNCSELIRSD